MHRKPTMFEKDLLLSFFAHHMTQDQRGELIATLPAAYNALVGAPIAKVVEAAVVSDRTWTCKVDRT